MISHNEAWEKFVGDQSVREFMDCSDGQSPAEAVAEYVHSAEFRANFGSIADLDQIADALAEHIRRSTTMAEKCLFAIRCYLASLDEGDTENLWGDVIAGSAEWPLDEAATDEADPSSDGSIAIFEDGSAVIYDEPTGMWVARSPEYVAQWIR